MSSQTKHTVFVHDWIFHIWGAESVFFDLIQTHTQHAVQEKIYTLFSDLESIEVDGYTYEIVTALPRWLNNIFVRWSRPYTWSNILASFFSSLFSSLLDYRNLIVWYPQLCRLLRRQIFADQPGHIVISSFAATKNIIPYWAAYRSYQVTLYLHSPNQYIRANHDEYVAKFSRWQKKIFGVLVPYLRRWDSKPRHYDTVITNSRYTASLAHQYYQLDHITVQYPTLDPAFDAHNNTKTSQNRHATKNYFVYIGRLTSFVREVDKIIQLCNHAQVPLIVMWSGPDETHLKSLAWPTVTFVWRVTDVKQKINILQHARWLINLAKESCGIATMEAIALGVPVFGYAEWGSVELVWPEQWLLVTSKDKESLEKWFWEFMKRFG